MDMCCKSWPAWYRLCNRASGSLFRSITIQLVTQLHSEQDGRKHVLIWLPLCVAQGKTATYCDPLTGDHTKTLCCFC